MLDIISVYRSNTRTITYTSNNLSLIGYTPYLTVKEDNSSVAVISKIGTVTDASTALFHLSPTDTSIAVKNYNYDITLVGDNSIYTVKKNTFQVLAGVKF